MPQMSPLGWFWLVIFVSFGYFMFLVFFYYILKSFLNFYGSVLMFNPLVWLW